MTEWTPDVCIYHGNCDDGFGAAWAVRARWPDCIFLPALYGAPLPDVSAHSNILLVDFSAPAATLLGLAGAGGSVVVIDHHKTAQQDLAGLAQFKGTQASLRGAFNECLANKQALVAVWFDMDQSGAAMAWQFATQTDRKSDSLPNLIMLIEDRDLWRMAYGVRTERFSAGLRSHPKDFAVWDQLAASGGRQLEQDGEAIVRARRLEILQLVDQTVFGTIAGHRVPVVNAPYSYASDTAAQLLSAYPDAPFAACWFQRKDGKLQFSLRSTDARADVSAIAKAFGGGGHRNAAGFEITQAASWLNFGAERQ